MAPQRICLVTGAAGGIGGALTAALRARGDVVVATDIATGARWLHHDVRSLESWQSVVTRTLDEHRRIDVLFNVAGVATAGRFVDLPADEIERHFAINVQGAALGMHLVLPLMRDARSGHVVNVASLAGVAAVPGIALYSATKFALRGLSLAVATEMAVHGVAVTVVHPDLVDTPMTRPQIDDPAAAVSFSGSRSLEADEVAAAIVASLDTRPLEVFVPASRGALVRFAGAFPAISRHLAPLMRKRGLARQAALRS